MENFSSLHCQQVEIAEKPKLQHRFAPLDTKQKHTALAWRCYCVAAIAFVIEKIVCSKTKTIWSLK